MMGHVAGRRRSRRLRARQRAELVAELRKCEWDGRLTYPDYWQRLYAQAQRGD